MQDGDFYLLLPAKRIDEIEKITEAQGLYINEIIFVHQTEKHKPFRIIVRGSFKKENKQIRELTIKVNNVYTPDFIKLLKDYYLNF
ncbi:hypothetical protein [Niabella ginsengisoli]|uniref:Uncharacterized protein n=1 Tax=Niabella ginsengisoli TaxID=522298 RepID=A0ABS9SH29_9BACT|nr:hypothetical protein [Niabella ginsengisoli]MCH5597676.1 hypothetical protein [Niabella ginsengisoli]